MFIALWKASRIPFIPIEFMTDLHYAINSEVVNKNSQRNPVAQEYVDYLVPERKVISTSAFSQREYFLYSPPEDMLNEDFLNLEKIQLPSHDDSDLVLGKSYKQSCFAIRKENFTDETLAQAVVSINLAKQKGAIKFNESASLSVYKAIRLIILNFNP
jgi:hypothetical protein